MEYAKQPAQMHRLMHRYEISRHIQNSFRMQEIEPVPPTGEGGSIDLHIYLKHTFIFA